MRIGLRQAVNSAHEQRPGVCTHPGLQECVLVSS